MNNHSKYKEKNYTSIEIFFHIEMFTEGEEHSDIFTRDDFLGCEKLIRNNW